MICAAALFLLFACGAETVRAASLELGNCSENILNGGVLASDASGDVVYYANTEKNDALYALDGDTETKLTSDAAANINVIEDCVYYTTAKGSGSAVYCYDVSTGKKTTCFTTSAEIEEMYVSSELTFYYLSDGDLYTRENGASVLTEESGKIVHFIPTAYGCITATGSLRNYKLYADGVLITSGVTSFYTADGYLLLEIGSDNYQARIRDLFDGDPASAVEEYTLGDGVDAVTALAEALEDDDCEVCEENAEEYAETGVKVDDIDAVTSSGTTSILNDSSVSDGQRNMVKRARQQHEITWTPLKTITGWGTSSSTYYFTAGTTYTGLPYGQPVYAAYVPWDATLEEFAAAVADVTSLMYTSKSSYNHTAPYYSCDCSSFVSWAWGLSSRQTTRTISSYATKVSSQSIYSVQIGDAFVLAGSHVVMVSDVGYDSDGNMVYVDIIEQTPPSTKLTRYGEGGSYTLDKLYSKYLGRSGTPYTLYRCKTRDDVTYTTCSAVLLDGESAAGTVTPSATTVKLVAGKSKTLTYTATVSGTASWKSSDTSVAKVSSSGKVTAVAVGKATITVTVGGASAKVTVYVKPVTTTLSSATATTSGGIKIKWKATAGAEGYRVYRKNEDGTWKKIADVTSTSYTDTGLTALTSYTYTVRAYVTLDGTVYTGSYDTTGVSATTLMTAPTLSKITAASTTSQKLTWKKVTGAEGYRVYKKVSGAWKRVGTTTKTSYTIKSLTTGTAYTYTVRAYYTENGITKLSSYDQTGLTATCCPPAPTLSAATGDIDGNITVTWKKVSGVTGYRIYRKTAGGSWKRVTAVKGASTVSYTDTGLTSGTTYYYTVRAYKKVSGKNVLSSYDTTGVTATSSLTKPGTPTLVSAVCSSYGTVTLTWKKASNAAGYRIYRKVNGKWKKVATVKKASTLTHTETGLTYGESYTYTVKAYRKVNGKTVWGSYDKTGISCTVKAAAPTIRSIDVSTAGQAVVRWKSVSGVSGYRVYYKLEDGKWTSVGNVGSSKTSKTITGLEAGTYYFAVRSYWKVDGKKYYSSYAKTKKARTIQAAETVEAGGNSETVSN